MATYRENRPRSLEVQRAQAEERRQRLDEQKHQLELKRQDLEHAKIIIDVIFHWNERDPAKAGSLSN